MKKSFLLIIFLISSLVGFSQCRFLDRVFPSIIRTNNVVYANAPQITPIFISEQTTIDVDLLVDIIQPSADTMQHRPVIIMAYAGGFFTGTKNTDDMQALADTFAHHGYLTCCMQYRLFFNGFSQGSAERAVYRAVQDVDALIRFLIENDNIFHVDSNQIFFIGSSAGAFAGLHHIFMDESERSASTYSGILQPDLGCKSCSGNNYVHEAKIKAMASCWGAIGDTNWIVQAEHDVPLILFHGDADPIVPYGYGYPFIINAAMPPVNGSSIMNERLNNENIVHEFYTSVGGGHEYWGSVDGFFITPPNSNWPIIINQINNFFYAQIDNPPCPVGLETNEETGVTIFTQEGNVLINSSSFIIDEIYLFDMQGRKITQKIVNSFQGSIDGLQHGTYIAYVYSQTKTYFFKIVM